MASDVLGALYVPFNNVGFRIEQRVVIQVRMIIDINELPGTHVSHVLRYVGVIVPCVNIRSVVDY